MADTETFAGCSLREKLRAIRDSDHPARHWARNIIQTLDESGGNPDADQLSALGIGLVMLERTMHHNVELTYPNQWLTLDEITSIFGLGDHQ